MILIQNTALKFKVSSIPSSDPIAMNREIAVGPIRGPVRARNYSIDQLITLGY
jgi:hypothetical protein